MKRGLALVLVALAASLGAAACSRILGLQDERSPRPFEHRAHTLKGIACTDCHEGMPSAGEEGELHLPSTERCVECHEEPHNPSECGQCHGSPATRTQARARKHHLRFQHGPHLEEANGQCVPCHAGAAHVGENAAPPMGVCLGCHQHEDQIETRDCEVCHIDLQEEMPAPDSHLVHGTDILRRHALMAASAQDLCTTCHTERFCAECHGVTVPTLPSRLRFDDPMANTMHRAAFVARHSSEARADPALCSTCHSEPFCNECHLENRVSALSETSRNPHPPGWVGALGTQNAHGRAARRDPASCASCHGGAGQMLCVRCHQVGGVGGNPHPPGWDSRKPLSELPCRLCHTSGF